MSRHANSIVVPALLVLCVAMLACAFSACGASSLPMLGPEGAGSRLTGGSVPDGELVNGTVVASWLLPPGATARGFAMPLVGGYIPARGASVVLLGPDGLPVQAESDDLGRFSLDASGRQHGRLTFALGDGSNGTTVELKLKKHESVYVVAGLVPDGESVSAGLDPEVSIRANATRVPVGATVLISATIDDPSIPASELVWVMRTGTDATLEPTARPDRIIVRTGLESGEAKVTAHLGDGKSHTITIHIEASRPGRAPRPPKQGEGSRGQGTAPPTAGGSHDDLHPGPLHW